MPANRVRFSSPVASLCRAYARFRHDEVQSQNRQNARRLLTEKQAKAEHARLAVEIAEHDKRYYQQDQPTIIGRRIRRAARALQRHRGALSRPAHAGIAVAESRRRAHRQVQESPARGADALARQRVRGAGRHRFRRPHPPLPQARRRREDRLQRRAEDRRAVDVAALRGRRTRHRRHPRRRRRGRGRHRQYPHAQGRAAEAQGQARAENLRGARRGLHDQGRLPQAQRAAEGGGRAIFANPRNSAAGSLRQKDPARHRLAPARLLRLCLGRR